MFERAVFASPLRVPFWLARFLFTAVREGSSSFLRFQPGYHGSTIPSRKWIERHRDRIFSPRTGDDGINLRSEEQRALLNRLADYFPDFDPPEHPVEGRLYHHGNTMFGFADAFLLYAMLRHFRPAQVVEIGSGYSSALMLDVSGKHLPDTRFVFVDPYSRTIGQVLDSQPPGNYRLVREPVQETDPALFETLGPGDILFIDTSHTVKIGSDLGTIFFEVLPKLKPGVIVHIHDIYYPWEYPEEFVMAGRTYNELYFVRAFLQFNNAFEILLNGAQMAHENPRLIRERFTRPPEFFGQEGSRSLWLRRSA